MVMMTSSGLKEALGVCIRHFLGLLSLELCLVSLKLAKMGFKCLRIQP